MHDYIQQKTNITAICLYAQIALLAAVRVTWFLKI